MPPSLESLARRLDALEQKDKEETGKEEQGQEKVEDPAVTEIKTALGRLTTRVDALVVQMNKLDHPNEQRLDRVC